MASTATPFKFNAELPAAQRAARQQAAQLVVNVSQKTRAGLRALIGRSIREGIPPREAARIIETMVGLDPRRAMAAMNFRAALFEQGLPLARVDVLTERYVKKKLRERALMIARSETITALNRGQLVGWEAAQKDGLLDATARKESIATPDDITCPICLPVDGQTQPLKKPFQTPAGEFQSPGYHAGCRCAMSVNP